MLFLDLLLTLYLKIQTFNGGTPPPPKKKKKKKKALETIGKKGENADNQHFLPFPQGFLLCQREESSF